VFGREIETIQKHLRNMGYPETAVTQTVAQDNHTLNTLLQNAEKEKKVIREWRLLKIRRSPAFLLTEDLHVHI